MLNLSLEKIRYLYLDKKLSSDNIAKTLGCSKTTILQKLRKSGIIMRPAGVPKIDLSDSDLKQLYLNKKLSSWKIASMYGYGRSTIHRKLMKLGISRDISSAHIKYKRVSFSGNLTEKAYLVGFAIGDLRVRKVGKNSKTIKVDCGSTKSEQINLIKDLFSKYGRVWIGNPTSNSKTQIEAFLDDSFSFLLNSRKNLGWIFLEGYFVPFLAGFTDAEGSIFLTSKKAAYSLGNYDSSLLRLIKKELANLGIPSHLYRNRKRYATQEGYMQNKLYWHLVINRKDSLMHLFNILIPHIKHAKRIADIKKATRNIDLRNSKKINH